MAALTDEDLRAREWREARARRVVLERDRRAALAGSETARERVFEAWEPILSREDCDGDEEDG